MIFKYLYIKYNMFVFDIRKIAMPDLSGYSAPVLCDGGTTTIAFTITDLCETQNVSVTFNVSYKIELLL